MIRLYELLILYLYIYLFFYFTLFIFNIMVNEMVTVHCHIYDLAGRITLLHTRKLV